MKKTLFYIISMVLLILTIYLPDTSAQDIPVTVLEGHWDGVRSVTFSPDGQTLASGSGDNSILASGDNTIRLWDAAIGEHIKTLRGHEDGVYSVAFSPDGQTLASGSGNDTVLGKGDDTIRLWDVATGRQIKIFTRHTSAVTSVAFSPDGQTLASGSSHGTIRLWDVATGKQNKILTERTSAGTSIVFSPDGQTLASGSWDATTRPWIIRLWDVETGDPIKTLTGHTSRVYSVAFSPNGQTLASGSLDETIRLWDVATEEQIKILTGHTSAVTSVVFSPDGQTLASGSWDDTIRLWDVATEEQIKILTGHTSAVTSVVFSPDGQTLASASTDNTIRLWKIPVLHLASIRITPNPVVSPVIGDNFSVNVHINKGKNVGGYQLTVGFDPTALSYVSSTNGSYLTEDSYFVQPVVLDNNVTLGATNFANVSSGDGILATITFEVIDVKESTLNLSNVILTDSDGDHLLIGTHDGEVVQPPPVPSTAIVRVTPSSVLSPARYQQLTLDVEIAGGRNIAAHRLFWGFDDEPLEFLSGQPGNYLADGIGNGDGTLFTGTFKIRTVKTSTMSVSGHLIGTDGLRYTPTFVNTTVVEPLFGDVNRDGQVNISDLVMVASSFNQRVSEEGNPADVSEDDNVNIVDLVKVAAVIGNGTAAPTVLNQNMEAALTRGDVQQWLSQAQQLNLTDATSQRGILFLQHLLAALTPKETALLPNYPNPFNPETWIPYQLAQPVDVTVTIYTVDGTVVRTLALGHQPVGIYQDKSRAAYWDGRNAQGELVASGVYFYMLKAGDFAATRKMLIRK